MMPEEALIQDVKFHDLCEGAGLAIWGFRSCAMGHSGCCTLAAAYHRALGEDFASTLADILTFVQMVGYHGKRKVHLSVPGCPHVTTDELLIAAVLAAAQKDDYARRDCHLTWLLGVPSVQVLSRLVDQIGETFTRHGLSINAPETALELSAASKAPSASAFFVWEGGRA